MSRDTSKSHLNQAPSHPTPIDRLRPWVRRRGWMLVASLGLMALVYWASDRSWGDDEGGLRLPHGSANLAHFLIYAAMTSTWAFAFGAAEPSGRRGRMRAWIAGWALATGFGLFDEWHQESVPGRHCSLFDAIENALGGLFGMLSWRLALGDESRTRGPFLWLGALFVAGVIVALYAGDWFPDIDAVLTRKKP